MASAFSGPGTIVVTGATGKVGSRLIQQLLQDKENANANANANDLSKKTTNGRNENVKIVALVRNAIKAREMLQGHDGADHEDFSIVEADFTNLSSLSSAFQNIQNDSNVENEKNNIHLFLACGNVPDQLDIESNVIQASAEKCSFCVKLSTAAPLMENKEDTGPYGLIHNQIEAKLDSSYDDKYCTLRPNIYMNMLEPAHGGPLLGLIIPKPTQNEEEDTSRSTPSSKTNLNIPHPYANKKISYITCDDVASCAKHILLSSKNNLQSHYRQRYELTGAEAFTISSLEESLSNLVEEDVTVSECTVKDAMTNAGLPDVVQESFGPHLACIAQYDTVTDTLETLTGKKATLVKDWIRDNADSFYDSSSTKRRFKNMEK